MRSTWLIRIVSVETRFCRDGYENHQRHYIIMLGKIPLHTCLTSQQSTEESVVRLCHVEQLMLNAFNHRQQWSEENRSQTWIMMQLITNFFSFIINYVKKVIIWNYAKPLCCFVLICGGSLKDSLNCVKFVIVVEDEDK